MAKRMWVYNPNSGGQKISPMLQEETRARILKHAAKIVPEKASQLRVSFRGQFCYIDFQEPGYPEPAHLLRLRHSLRGWTMALYTYSNEKYQPSVFGSGDFHGTPEEAFDIGANFL